MARGVSNGNIDYIRWHMTRRYHHGNLRRASLDAALTHIGDHGAEGLTLRRVAREAGVSHTAVGKEFGGMGALYAACATHIYNEVAAAQREAAAPLTPGLDTFAALGAAYVQVARDHPNWLQFLGHPLVVEQYGTSAELRGARQSCYELLLQGVHDAIAEGSIRDGDPVDIAVHAWSAVHGFALLSTSKAMEHMLEGEPDAWAERLLASMYLGFRPEDGPRPHEEAP